eukprot:1146844-Pelagomonas_calceolata.AAC.4
MHGCKPTLNMPPPCILNGHATAKLCMVRCSILVTPEHANKARMQTNRPAYTMGTPGSLLISSPVAPTMSSTTSLMPSTCRCRWLEGPLLFLQKFLNLRTGGELPGTMSSAISLTPSLYLQVRGSGHTTSVALACCCTFLGILPVMSQCLSSVHMQGSPCKAYIVAKDVFGCNKADM